MKIKKLMALLLAGALTVSAFMGCGVDKNATLATAGDQKVSVGIVNLICRHQQAMMDDVYVGYFGADVWTQDLSGTGSTMEDDVKAQMVELAHEMYTLKDHMSDYNVEITAEEETKIAEAAKAFMEANSKEALKEMGATEDLVNEMLTLYTIQNKMREAIIADTNKEVSDEEANMRAYSMVNIGLTSYYDTETLKTITYTDEEKTKRTENAKKMAEELKAGGEGVTLESVAKKYEFEVTTGTYDADNTTLDANVKKALDALSEGGVSEMITTDSAIYFVRLDKETDEKATESNKESIITERENELYNETLEGWQKDDGWKVDEDKLEQIKFRNLFTQESESSETETATTTTQPTESAGTESTETEAVEATQNSTEE